MSLSRTRAHGQLTDGLWQWDTDFEIGLVNDPSWATLQAAAQAAYSANAAFDFTPWLLA